MIALEWVRYMFLFLLQITGFSGTEEKKIFEKHYVTVIGNNQSSRKKNYLTKKKL